MKWGVRRYQNYDGSYTKKGLERYNKAQSDYDIAKKVANQSKVEYKSGKISKSAYKLSKGNLRVTKRELNKSYDKLKSDKMADEGKKFYQRGKTITDNSNRLAFSEAAVIVGSTFTSKFLSQSADWKISMLASSAIAIGGTFVNAMLAAKTSRENKRLRAYYAH